MAGLYIRDKLFSPGVCDEVTLQVMALHQRLVVEVRHTSVFDIATHIKYLIGGHVVSEVPFCYLASLKKIGWKEFKWIVGLDHPW